MNLKLPIIERKDRVQIKLNILAFLILYLTTGGHGSFWGFFTFNIISALIFIEICLSTDKTAFWLWATKTATYILICIKFFSNKGEFRIEYVYMMAISATAVLISRRLKNRSFSAWGQVIAYIIGGVMYVMAIISDRDHFGIGHICFWLVNLMSYSLLIGEVYAAKKPSYNYIIPGYALVGCVVYIILMVFA